MGKQAARKYKHIYKTKHIIMLDKIQLTLTINFCPADMEKIYFTKSFKTFIDVF